jgi:hypothetical protein
MKVIAEAYKQSAAETNGKRSERKFRLVSQDKNSNNRKDQADFFLSRLPFILVSSEYFCIFCRNLILRQANLQNFTFWSLNMTETGQKCKPDNLAVFLQLLFVQTFQSSWSLKINFRNFFDYLGPLR